MVNVTKDEIVTRDAIVSEHAWPNKSEHDDFGKLNGSLVQICLSDWKAGLPKF